MKALCIGRSNYDFYSLVDSLEVTEGTKEVNEVIEGAGGSAVNTAYTLGKFGIETYMGSVVGDDTFGNIVRKELEKVGVHTEYMETAYDKRTAFVLTMIKKDTKEKRSYSISKEKLVLKKTEFQMEPDLVYSDGYDYGASLTAFNKYSNKITVINAKACSQETIELCKYCKYIIAPREFAEWVSGTKIDFDNPGSLVTVFSNLLKRFYQKEIIVTLGNKGALDIFGGAFAYALLQNYDLEKAITFANIAGGLSVTKLGISDSVPDISAIMTYFNQKYGTEKKEEKLETPVAQ